MRFPQAEIMRMASRGPRRMLPAANLIASIALIGLLVSSHSEAKSLTDQSPGGLLIRATRPCLEPW